MAIASEEVLRAYAAEILKRRSAKMFTEELFSTFDRGPLLHGAIDFDRGADGVWRLPTVWVDGDTIHFGFDKAKPGSDRTAYWSAWR